MILFENIANLTIWILIFLTGKSETQVLHANVQKDSKARNAKHQKKRILKVSAIHL